MKKKSQNLCILPWIHWFADINGNVFPCCSSNNFLEPLGNIRMNTFPEIFNNSDFKKLRLEMLNGEKPEICKKCYIHEEKFLGHNSSYRQIANRDFNKYLKVVDKTLPDGSITECRARFVDIRFSNICNFKCRICNINSSSSIAQEEKTFEKEYRSDLEVFIKAGNDKNYELIEELIHQIPFMEKISFVGGEPLIMDEHYRLLDNFLEKNRTDIEIIYNSNGSMLSYKKKKILDYWKQFENVTYCVSLDTWGERAEYSRHGTNWKQIISNIKLVRQECPHVEICFNCVLSFWNCLTIVDFITELENEGIIENDNNTLNLQLLTDPEYFRITVLPLELREIAIQKMKIYIKEKTFPEDWIRIRLKEIIEYMKQPQETHLEVELKKIVLLYDNRRTQNFTEVFPEMKEWFESIIFPH